MFPCDENTRYKEEFIFKESHLVPQKKYNLQLEKEKVFI